MTSGYDEYHGERDSAGSEARLFPSGIVSVGRGGRSTGRLARGSTRSWFHSMSKAD